MSIEKDNIEGAKKAETSVLDYLTEKNKTLKNDYTTPDGKYAESCTLIAIDIAKILLSEGKKPEIIFVTGKRIDNPHIIASESLRPTQYSGKISWGGHVVCACEGMIYDPMIGEPVQTEDYAHKAFGGDIEMKTTVTQDEIEEFIKK